MTATKVGKVLANLNKETAVAEVAVSLVSTYGNTPTDVISNSKESFLGQLSSKDARKLFLSMDWLIRTGKFDGKYLDVEQIDQVRQCIVNHILEHEHEYEINSQTVNECVSQGR